MLLINLHTYMCSWKWKGKKIITLVVALQFSCCCSAIPRKDWRGVRGALALALSASDRCSNRVFVINSTLLALKTLHSCPFIISLLSERQPHIPALLLAIYIYIFVYNLLHYILNIINIIITYNNKYLPFKTNFISIYISSDYGICKTC